jgi:hypothetical protein
VITGDGEPVLVVGRSENDELVGAFLGGRPFSKSRFDGDDVRPRRDAATRLTACSGALL